MFSIRTNDFAVYNRSNKSQTCNFIVYPKPKGTSPSAGNKTVTISHNDSISVSIGSRARAMVFKNGLLQSIDGKYIKQELLEYESFSNYVNQSNGKQVQTKMDERLQLSLKLTRTHVKYF